MVHRSSSGQSACAVLLLLTAMASCSGTTLTDGGPPHDVKIVADAGALGPNAFSPPGAVISLSSQDVVTWYNADFSAYGGPLGTSHHIKSDDGTTFDSGTLAPYGTFQATFTTPGTYAYHCEFHPEMTGTVTVNP
jgi:plastocyanin